MRTAFRRVVACITAHDALGRAVMIGRGHLTLIKSDPSNADAESPRVSSEGDKPRILDRRRIVLVADPDTELVLAIGSALTDVGIRPILAHSGEDAIAVVGRERVDGLIVDLHIPDMRGDVLFELASTHQPHLRHATIFVTVDLSPASLRLIEACGCESMPKPLDAEGLANAIGRLIQ
jgi:CheY-like chemotaxis protein